nr:uncharacterized protein LOC123290107 [Equus asinus]
MAKLSALLGPCTGWSLIDIGQCRVTKLQQLAPGDTSPVMGRTSCVPAYLPCGYQLRLWADGTSEKVEAPTFNPDEQEPEDEGFPRRELVKYRFSLGLELRKVNKTLLLKPEIPSKRIPGRQRVVIKNTEIRTMGRAQSLKGDSITFLPASALRALLLLGLSWDPHSISLPASLGECFCPYSYRLTWEFKPAWGAWSGFGTVVESDFEAALVVLTRLSSHRISPRAKHNVSCPGLSKASYGASSTLRGNTSLGNLRMGRKVSGPWREACSSFIPAFLEGALALPGPFRRAPEFLPSLAELSRVSPLPHSTTLSDGGPGVGFLVDSHRPPCSPPSGAVIWAWPWHLPRQTPPLSYSVLMLSLGP